MEGITPEYPWCRHYIIEKFRDMYRYEISQAQVGNDLGLPEEQASDIQFLMNPMKSSQIPRHIRFTPPSMIDSDLKEIVRDCDLPELQGMSQSKILDAIRVMNPQFNVGEVFSHARMVADIRRSLGNIQDPLLRRIHDLITEGYITRADILNDGVTLRLDPRVIDSITSLVRYPLVTRVGDNIRRSEDTLQIYVDPNTGNSSLNTLNGLKRMLQDTSISLEPFNIN
jgi:hypothetical protein